MLGADLFHNAAEALATGVEAGLAAGEPERAERLIEALDDLPPITISPYLDAQRTLSKARLGPHGSGRLKPTRSSEGPPLCFAS
jgi:hypothetical protein